MKVRCRAVAGACLWLGLAAAARAQVYIPADAPHRGSVEISAGGVWMGGFDMGRSQAQLTRSTQADRFDLFTAHSEARRFSGVHGRVGLYLTRALSVEGGVRAAHPRLSIRLSGDAESAPDETAVETLSQYIFDASVLFHLTRASFAGGRGVPFVSGGAGYLRELHEGNQLVETGREFHGTFGVKYWFGGGSRRLGLRGEIGISSREKGFDHEQPRRLLPIALGGAAFIF